MNNWQTIASNAHKVGLTAYVVLGDSEWESDKTYSLTPPIYDQEPFTQLVTLLRFVHAIEAAGLAGFMRHPGRHNVQSVYWTATIRNPRVLVEDDLNDSEHESLAAVVARVLEQLPEVGK